MANIHQTLKRVEALYADLLGTREELTRCVQELQRWQSEQEKLSREGQQALRELRTSVARDVEYLGETVRHQRRQMEQVAANERWVWLILLCSIAVALLSRLWERTFKWIFPQF